MRDAAPRARRPSGVQDGRHLRGGVRRAHAVPLLELRPRDRGRRRSDRPEGHHPGLRAEPDRPGHRVRLLLRARRPSRCRDAGFETDHDQLQPGDRLDRLRHQRPALLRAAHARGRARGRARRAAERRARRRRRAARRPDRRSGSRRGSRTPACRSSAPRPRRSTWPRSAALFGRDPRRGRPARAAARHRHHVRRGRWPSPTRSATRCWCARPTCWAGAAWRSSTTTRIAGRLLRAGRRLGIIGPDHPLLVDRFLDDAIEIDVDALFDGTELYIGGIMEHIEEAGIHSGDSACTLPPITLGRDDIEPRARRDARRSRRGVGVRGLLNVQFAIGQGRALRARGQPARVAHRAVRVQGDRGPAGQGGGADRARAPRIARAARRGAAAGAGRRRSLPLDAPVAVKEAVLPFKRFRTKDGDVVDSVLGPGDEVHRRGHGHRLELRHRASPSARRPPTARCRPRARSSSRSPTATSAR